MQTFWQICIIVGVLSLYPTPGVSAQTGKAEQAKIAQEPQARIRQLIAMLGPDPQRSSDIGGGEAAPTIEARDELIAIGKPSVLPLCEVLKEQDDWRRIMAAEALAEIRDPRSLPFLIGILRNDPKMELRGTAAEALGNIGDKEAVGPLLDALKERSKDPDNISQEAPAYLAGKAAEALGKIGDRRAIRPLLALLGSRETMTVGFPSGISTPLGPQAAIALAKIGTQVADPLLKALNHQSRDTRTNAAMALGRIKERRAVPRLIALVGKPETKEARIVQEDARAAVRALGEIGDKRAGDALLPYLDTTYPEIIVIVALGQIREERAIPFLLQRLPETNAWGRTEAMVAALGNIGTPACVDALIDRLQRESNTYGRAEAAVELGKLKAERALPVLWVAFESQELKLAFLAPQRLSRMINSDALLPYLQSPETRLRRVAACGLENAGVKKAVPQLLEMLSVEETRSIVIQALGELGAPEILPRLEPFMQDEDSFIRSYARQVIVAIKRRHGL